MADMEIKKRFGQNVRHWREHRGYSQEELADQAGLHRTYVGSVERGERNISLLNIVTLATTLGVEVAGLFEGISPQGLTGEG